MPNDHGVRPTAAAASGPPLPPLLRRLALVLLLSAALLPLEARAHHLMDLLQLRPTAAMGLLSGLVHPVIGPDHLLFLLALSLVGLQHRSRWMLALLLTGLAGSLIGLLLPGLPGGEALVAFTLVLVALVLLGRLDRRLLLPAFALHGYVLAGPVLGWTTAPLAAYLLGLVLSQAALLLLALQGLRRLCGGLDQRRLQLLATALLGCGAAWTWSALVG